MDDIYQHELKTYRRDSRRSVNGYLNRKRRRIMDSVRERTKAISILIGMTLPVLATQITA